MQVNVAVFDPLPVFRIGLMAALGLGGTDLSSRDEVAEWLVVGRGGLLLLTLGDDDAWALLGQVSFGPEVQVVAILEPFSVATAARALRAGAVNVVARDSAPSRFRRVVAEVLDGSLTISHAILRATTATSRQTQEAPAPTDDELGWLRALASGSSVAALASSVGYSERMMFRRLSDLYARLGVRTRTQALMLAQDEGWI